MPALDSIITVAAADSPMSPALPGSHCSRCPAELHDHEPVVVCEWNDITFAYCVNCARKFRMLLSAAGLAEDLIQALGGGPDELDETLNAIAQAVDARRPLLKQVTL